MNSTSHLSRLLYVCESWRIWSGESRPLKTNATGGCLACHTEGIKQTNIYGNRSLSSPDVGSFYCQSSSVASWHGLAMSVMVIRCRISYYKEQWMVVVNHGRTTSRNKQTSQCGHCCASQMTEVDGSRCICLSAPTTPGVMGITSWLVLLASAK